MHDMNKDMELSKYRFSLAEETYKSAKMCFDNGFYRDCIIAPIMPVFLRSSCCSCIGKY